VLLFEFAASCRYAFYSKKWVDARVVDRHVTQINAVRGSTAVRHLASSLRVRAWGSVVRCNAAATNVAAGEC